MDENSSLLWLCRQQGVSKEELEKAIRIGSYYPKEMEAVLDRREEVRKALRALGYIPDQPMEPHRQKGELSKLLRAEQVVQNLQQKIHRCENNLTSCNLSYEEFCQAWSERNHSVPPNEEAWSRNKESVQERHTHLLDTLLPEFDSAQSVLQSYRKDPHMAMVADLRDRLLELNKEYNLIRQTPEYKKGQFLESVIQESANTTTHMNALTALVKMPLKEAIALANAIRAEAELNADYDPKKRKGEGSVLLDQNTTLGLYDAWNGAGGLFEIKLCQPLELPIRYIHDANVDGTLGYSIQQIYGGLEHGETLKEIRSMPESIKPPLNQVLQSVQPTPQEKQSAKSENSRSER